MGANSGGALRLALCGAGIYGAYLLQGKVQEDLSTRRWVAAAACRRHIAIS
jgi:hypothetical protein